MTMPSTWKAASVLLGCTLFATGCDTGSPQTPQQAAQTSAESFEKFGNYELHFNGVRTDQLTAEVASTYGIERSKNRVLLNVTLLRREADGAPLLPVEGTVSVDAYNLNGQLKNLEVRRITEGKAIYYIGEVTISGSEILVFDIKATPSGESQVFTARFQREFFAD
jgi:Domain of unknown function (DUF4426)